MLRLHYVVAGAFLALCALALAEGRGLAAPDHPSTPFPGTAAAAPTEGAEWFGVIKPFCNVVEAEIAVTRIPPPRTVDGLGYAAACFALAGKPHRARGFLLEVDAGERWRAAGIVFEVGHPIADQGDDRSAAPIMELVVEFWPNHYMALYHAGAAGFALGRPEAARSHLEAFLRYYTVDDGWRGAARGMLKQLRAR